MNDLCGMAGIDQDCDIIDDDMGESMNFSQRINNQFDNEIVVDKNIIGGGI